MVCNFKHSLCSDVTLVYIQHPLSDFTGVACYSGKLCGETPVHLPTVGDCCQNVSALKSFRTAKNPDTCSICLGNEEGAGLFNKLVYPSILQ